MIEKNQSYEFKHLTLSQSIMTETLLLTDSIATENYWLKEMYYDPVQHL